MAKVNKWNLLKPAIAALLLLIVLAGFPSGAFGATSDDKASLSGFVKDADSKETLISATVYLKNTKLNSRTNKSGYYSITNIPPGKYVLIVSLIGYIRLEREIELKQGQALRKDIELKIGSVQKENVVVTADREVEKRQISISKVDIPVSIIKEIRIGGESDVFRTLQFLPGVLTSSQISSGLYVRGGSPDQNLVLLDGSTVYNPTHLFGFISTFNSDAIKDVELIKGGFPSEYGGRLSAVLNITQKDGDREKTRGVASIGVISSRLSFQGPSPIGEGSWFMAGRRTYLEVIKSFFPEDPLNPLPNFNFYDLNGKITQEIGSDDKVTFSGFLSQDYLDYASTGVSMNLTVGNKLGASKWTHIFKDNLFSTINLSASQYYNTFRGDQSGYGFLINNSINDYSLKANLEWFTSEKLTHKFGYELTNYTFDYLQNMTGNADSVIQKGTSGPGVYNNTFIDWNHSVFAQVNYNFIDLMSIQAGLRANYWTLSKMLTFDPRLAFRYQIQEDVAIKLAWGIFHQDLKLVTQPDFSFFDTWLPTDSTVAVSTSYHYIFSLETRPAEGWDLNFDFYYKRLNNINELNTRILQVQNASDLFFTGNATAYGLEVFLQRKYGRFTGWFGYGLGYIEAKFDQINEGRPFRPKYDRRHDLKFVAQYEINDRWNVGATFTFQTGQSYTGYTSIFPFRMDGQTVNHGKTVPSERYGLRLPPSHQLNLNATFSFKTFGLDSKLILDIYNVYNRRDIWFRYPNSRGEVTFYEDVRLLPILPTVSYELNF